MEALSRAGIYGIHKPIGPSSFAALKAVAPYQLKSCHGGTLDPFASGLLLVLVEPATQLFDLLHDVPKVYEATIRWGIETDNGDPTGATVREADADSLTAESIEAAMQSFVGWHDQVPPATSAKRIDGERAYERVRRGETVAMTASRAYLHDVTWIEQALPLLSRVRITVRGGFYVRSLVRDLGRALGTAAHLSSLHRAAIGPWVDPPVGEIQMVEPLPWLPTRVLRDAEVHELKSDRPINVGELLPPAWQRPASFPADAPLIRGFHLGRFNFVLEQRESRLYRNRLIRGGIEMKDVV